MKPIFNGSYFEAMNVKNILADNDISVFVQNEYMGTIEPWVVTPAGFNPVILQVHEDDFEIAKQIVNDYHKLNATE